MRSSVVMVVVVAASGVVHARPATVPAPIAVPPPTDPQPRGTFAANLTLLADEYAGAGLEIAIGHQLGGKRYVDVAAIIGLTSLLDPAGSGQEGGSLSGVRGGLSHVHCGDVGCRGVGLSIGIEHQTLYGTDGLLDDPTWTESRTSVFVEGRALARVRLGDDLAVEISAALRGDAKLRGAGDRTTPGLVLALGLVATI